MQATLRIQTTILPGNRIEICAPELPEGRDVEVLVLLPEAPDLPRRSALDIIASLQGRRLFKTPEEVDKYLQEERDSWDR